MADYSRGKSNADLVEIVRIKGFDRDHRSPDFDKVLDAMLKVDRKEFLPEGVSHSVIAYVNAPLTIYHNQTCSAPHMVAAMCDLLELREGMRVLEIGTGCGYHAAITSELIGPSGYLVTVEIIPQLAEFGKNNLENHFGKENLEERLKVIHGDGPIGLEEAPFDRIYLTASVDLKSFDLLKYIRLLNKDDGIFLYPERHGPKKVGDLIRNRYQEGTIVGAPERISRVYFVPLTGANT